MVVVFMIVFRGNATLHGMKARKKEPSVPRKFATETQLYFTVSSEQCEESFLPEIRTGNFFWRHAVVERSKRRETS